MSNTEDFQLWNQEMMKHLMQSVPQDKLQLRVALAMLANELRRAYEWPITAVIEVSDAYVEAAKILVGDNPENHLLVLKEKLGELVRKYGLPS